MLENKGFGYNIKSIYSISFYFFDSNEVLTVRCNSSSILDYFPLIQSHGVTNGDVLATQIIGYLLSNQESLMNPCKDLFSVSLLAHIAEFAVSTDSIKLFLSVLCCVIPSLELIDQSQEKNVFIFCIYFA